MTTQLHDLEALLRDRLATRPEGSYSLTLLTDVDLAQRKIMEEAFELCQELGKPSVDDERAVSEAADLLFHTLAGLVGAGIRLDDVLAELATRRAAPSNKGTES